MQELVLSAFTIWFGTLSGLAITTKTLIALEARKAKLLFGHIFYTFHNVFVFKYGINMEKEHGGNFVFQ